MNIGKTVFSQLLDFIPSKLFNRCVNRFNGNYRARSFSCWDQYLCMSFAQLTFRESLRDTVLCLNSLASKLYHNGIKGKVTKSTLADANEKRSWRIYSDFANELIKIARELYSNDNFSVELKETAYALDSSTISLCLSMFPWAKFRKNKGAIKLHTLMDLRGNIPAFIAISDGKLHDVNVLDKIVPEPGAFYIMDRGYLDFRRLHVLNNYMSYFITRTKKNTSTSRIYSNKVDKSTGLLCDQYIKLKDRKASKDYPDRLRRIKYYDKENDKKLTFITNNFIMDPITITQLYRSRWQIELFFKWIKQHLRIKTFYGTSENAVRTQIWIAVSVYVLVSIVRKKLMLDDLRLYRILQILSVTLFEKSSLYETLRLRANTYRTTCASNQLKLFES
jgi:transposase